MVAPVPPTLTNVVKKPLAVTYGRGRPSAMAATFAARYCRKIGATIGVHGVVAVDPHGPEHGDEEGVHQDARQRVQGEHQRCEGGLHDVVDVDSEHEADQPEDDDEDAERDERQERLVHDVRHAGRHPDHEVGVGEDLLDAHRDQRHDDRREQPVRSKAWP